jgi:hypothetical protein
VEMTFRLGDQLHALEHTGIEPFDGFMAHQNRASSLFLPLQAAAVAALAGVLVNGVVFEMHLPIDAFTDRKMSEVRVIQTALLAWIAATTPMLPPRRYADYQGTLVTAQPGARADAPDETYMVSTCTSPWYAWPVLVDGQSYFDLAAISHPIHFEMDATGRLLKPAA